MDEVAKAVTGETGREVELEVTKVAHGGVFVARHEGRVVFVSEALPGERVLARVGDVRHESFWRAETVRVLEPSPHRRQHVWCEASLENPPGARAGGAEFGHIDAAYQRELKRQVIVEAFERMAGLDVELEVENVGANPAEREGIEWRTRVRLHVDSAGRVGPYAARTHRVVPVRSLPLARDAVATAAVAAAANHGAARMRRGRRTDAAIDIVEAASGVHVLAAPRRGSRTAAVPVTERVGDREFALDARGFWQVHTRAPEVLTRAVQDALDPALLDVGAENLDLYGGVGLLAAAVGEFVGAELRIETVEAEAGATLSAAANLSDWPHARAVTERVDRYLERRDATASDSERDRLRAATVVLDPPRSGAGRGVVVPLARLRPAQLVYVACDPVALARDVALFAREGYVLSSLRAFDLFPNTHHVESVAVLVPAD